MCDLRETATAVTVGGRDPAAQQKKTRDIAPGFLGGRLAFSEVNFSAQLNHAETTTARIGVLESPKVIVFCDGQGIGWIRIGPGTGHVRPSGPGIEVWMVESVECFQSQLNRTAFARTEWDVLE